MREWCKTKTNKRGFLLFEGMILIAFPKTPPNEKKEKK